MREPLTGKTSTGAARPCLGVALSGGGVRATLFALGALLYPAVGRPNTGVRRHSIPPYSTKRCDRAAADD
jgi:hypothetical protein